jgi:hypothetical protein
MESKNVVEQHVAFFADANGVITPESIKEGHERLGIDLACGKSRVIMTLVNKCSEPTAKCLAKMHNPAATPLWINGEFQEPMFQELCKKSIQHREGVQIITQGILEEFRAQHACPNATDYAAFVGICPVSWNRITSGSLSELTNWSDCYWINEKGQEERAWTVGALRSWYEDNGKALRKRAELYTSIR